MRTASLADVKARLQELLKKSRESIAAGKGLSRDQFWKTVAERRKAKSKKD